MTSNKERVSKTRKLIQAEYEANELADLKQRQTRARSFSVGTTTGGIIELNMRGDFSNLWYQVNPVEAVELIEQLAAAAGLEIAKRPKNDFTSWRTWDANTPDFSHWKGSAPWQINADERDLLAAIEDKRKTGVLNPASSIKKEMMLESENISENVVEDQDKYDDEDEKE